MNIICMEDEAFYALLEQVVERVTNKLPARQFQWIPDKEAMRLLNIKSKSTLQNLRDEGKIEFTQPSKKIVLYNIDSIYAYLEKHKRKPF